MKPVDQTIAEAVDATFMQRGFNAQRHAAAIIEALGKEGYTIIPTYLMVGSGRPKSEAI
jgi:hypothetical protein